MSRRVLIVGAGPGGLAAAMLLARAGVRVKVIERQAHVGGRTSTFSLGPFTFDLGPTFFLYPRVLAEVFAACGRRLEDEVELVRLDPQYRVAFGAGGQLDCTPRLDAMEQQLAQLSPVDAPALRRFLADNRGKLERFRPCLERPFLGWSSLLSASLLALLPLLRPHRSLDDELRTYFSDERIRLAFSFQSKYLGMSPFRCPSLFSILSYLEYEHGVWHPIGGCGQVTEAMARVARDLGVEVALGAPGPTGRSSGRASPARPSCSTWASTGPSATCRTTRSTSRRTTPRTWTRSSGAGSSPRTRPSTCRTPA